MTITTQKMTLEAFLAYDDGTDHLYELENGELIEMPFESEINRRIVMFLVAYFLQQGISSDRLTMKTEIVVSGTRTSVRVPDLMVLSEELVTALTGATRSLISMDMPPPSLVVEVVSPKQENRDYRFKRCSAVLGVSPMSDYIKKRSEYAAREISEYWIVDPINQKVTILEWAEGFYEERVYRQEELIHSTLFGQLTLTASRVLQGS